MTELDGPDLTDVEVDHLLYEVGWWHGIPWVPSRKLAVYIENLRKSSRNPSKAATSSSTSHPTFQQSPDGEPL